MTALDRALSEAIHDPGARPHFYRALLDADVYVVTANSAEDLAKNQGARGGLKLLLYESNGEMVVPFFTSAEKLDAALRERPGWVKLRTRDFLRMVKNEHSVLNPGYAEQWTFCPSDVAALLDGAPVPMSLLDPLESELLPAAPGALPQTVAAGLISFFKKQIGVGAAYVVTTRSNGAPDRTLVVLDIETGEEVREIVDGLRLVVQQLEGAAPDLFRLVLLLPGESTPTRKFIESVRPDPFYRRRPPERV
jgi:hypothetical protein